MTEPVRKSVEVAVGVEGWAWFSPLAHRKRLPGLALTSCRFPPRALGRRRNRRT